MTKVLVVATSRKTRGGITSVVKAHEGGSQWEKFHCHWVQTHRDGPAWRKMAYFARAILDFSLRLPFYDIVHVHASDVGSQKRKLIFEKLAKRFGKKLIFHLHSSGPEFSIRSQEKQLYVFPTEKADKIIVLSKTWESEYLDAMNPSPGKIAVLYNPCPYVRPSLPEEREKYILFAGTLTGRKGYADLLRAFALVARKYPDWKVKFAGNGEVDDAMLLAKELGIETQTEFLGWVNNEAKDSVFRHAAAYCLPSYSEGFPMGVLDAWSYHLPVITTPVGGMPDVGVDGENMLLFNPGDIQALAGKIEQIITDKNLYARLESASAEFAQKTFNVRTICKELEDIYNSLE